MRRPKATKAQRAHMRVQRATRRLVVAAVTFSTVSEGEAAEQAAFDHAFAFADLVAACDAIRHALPLRELRKLTKRRR